MKKVLIILIICFGINSYSQDSNKKPGILTVQSSYMYSENGCNHIWVGVFETIENQTLLISYGEVLIGEGCPKKVISSNSNCHDEVLNGDLITSKEGNTAKYCLVDLLKKDDVYIKFVAEKNRLLSTIKK